jgi:hypothetical protein
MRIAPSGIQALLSRGALWRASLIMREARTDRAQEKYGHVKRETGPVQGRAGVVPAFRSSVELRQIKTSKNKRRKRNAGKRRVTNRRILRCGARPFGARTLVGVPPRLSPEGVSHPKGSASGQASWDVVCTGVTRLRLSQSRDAPPTPVIMPGDMMPKPPGIIGTNVKGSSRKMLRHGSSAEGEEG